MRASRLLAVAFGAASLLHAAATEPSTRLREWPVCLPAIGSPSCLDSAAGFFSLSGTTAGPGEMFYMYFRARGDADGTAPVVLWMTGGPGCSSELAAFYENGPYTIDNATLGLHVNPFGWDVASHLVYVDQPIGTGFSHSPDKADIPGSEEQVSRVMLEFVRDFLAKHPELAARDFFVTGESYGGHYVPSVAHRIFTDAPSVNLKGFAVGNGMTEPAVQFGYYAPYALNNSLISEAVYEEIQGKVLPQCEAKVAGCRSAKTKEACVDAMDTCLQIPDAILEAAGDVNLYDIRKPCDAGPLCYDFGALDRFIALKTTRAALGVGDLPWSQCSHAVFEAMEGDYMRDYEPVIPAMLESGIRVLIYAGEDDFICNWVGNLEWLKGTVWSGQAGFNAAEPQPFVVGGEVKGYFQSHENLAFLRVKEAGHMVPMDQPEAALELLRQFVVPEGLRRPPARGPPDSASQA